MKSFIACLLFICWTASVSAATAKESWTPEVKFRLEGGSYVETLHWISGFSYALSETAKVAKRSRMPGVYCAPNDGHIGSKELLEILNTQFAGKEINSETASTALLAGVRRRFPCK